MSVSDAVAAFVDGLGQLSARQAVAAAQARRLGQLIDEEESGSAAAALARELRQVVGVLEPAVHPGVQVSGFLPDDEAAADPVAAAIDEVARKRRERSAQ